ncbi:hypothetical protein AB0C01_07505 [Micromonospora sp. NPDC048905]|uniref:hypothetical protein n=1 Tax=Micromonospora sp. NPDC048905 TaxID=3155494 RepID=UPI0033EC90BD
MLPRLDRADEALAVHRAALDSRQRVISPDHPDIHATGEALSALQFARARNQTL